MYPGDTGSWPKPTKEDRLPDVVLRFVETRHLRAEQGLLLVRYAPLAGEPHRSAISYRTSGAWVGLSPNEDKDQWFFEGPESKSAAEYSQFFDLLPRFEGTVAAHLHKAAVEWFDSQAHEASWDIRPEAFCSESPRLEVRLLPQSRCRIELATEQAVWHRTTDGSWKLEKCLSIQDSLQRSAANSVADRHLQAAWDFRPEIEDEHEGRGARLDEALGIAMAIGASFPVIPTFDSHLLFLAEESALDWQSAHHVIATSAKAGFLCNDDGQATKLVVHRGKNEWIRKDCSWVRTHGQVDSHQRLEEMELSRLPDAVRWWDTDPGPVPVHETDWYATSDSVSFVTDVDPYESRDFPLLDLVLGAIDDGAGLRRRSGHWEEEYVGALDIENHMPTDEGDLRPWGGQYLYVLSPYAAALALEFWDFGRRDCSKYDFMWSDFARWMAGRSYN